MSKKIKSLIQEELKTRFEKVADYMVLSIRGLKGTENNLLRGDLRKQGIRLNVVKNSLAGRAFRDLGRGAVEPILSGPCAIAYGADSIVDLSKTLVQWSEKLEPIEIKGAWVDGKLLDAQAAINLSKMPNRRELSGILVRQITSPGQNLSRAVISPAASIAGCIKAMIDQRAKTEAA